MIAHLSQRRLRGIQIVAAFSLSMTACRPSEFSAKRVAERNVKARGGLDAWRAVKTMSLSGRLDAGVPRDPARQALAYQMRYAASATKKPSAPLAVPADKVLQLPFAMELARPRKSRLEIQFQGETAVQVYDGEHGWKMRPFLGRKDVEPFSNDELLQSSQQDQLDGILIDYAAKGSRLDLVATEKTEGREADKIKVTLANGQVRHVWVDKQNGLEVKLDGFRRLDGKVHTVWTFFRDYRSVDGLMIPHLLETVVDGVSGSEKIIVEKVVINPPLEDSRFEKPKVPLALMEGGSGAVLTNTIGGLPTSGGGDAKLKRATRSTASFKLPSVSLIRDDGQTVSFPQVIDDGKPVVLNFIFTSCTTICPVLSQLFSQLQERLGADRSKVHMASISIDPERDRPERLAAYAKRFHAGPQWHYYTGTVEASLAIQRAFEAYRGDKMDHTPVTFVRARRGGPWVRIDGYATPDELAAELRPMIAAVR